MVRLVAVAEFAVAEESRVADTVVSALDADHDLVRDADAEREVDAVRVELVAEVVAVDPGSVNEVEESGVCDADDDARFVFAYDVFVWRRLLRQLRESNRAGNDLLVSGGVPLRAGDGRRQDDGDEREDFQNSHDELHWVSFRDGKG